jgi:hypothetical protein
VPRSTPLTLAAIVLLAVGVAGPVLSQPIPQVMPTPPPPPLPAPPPPLPAPVSWTKVPTAAEMSASFPRAACDEGMSGQVVLDCALQTGRLNGCSVFQERPRDQGFAAAALGLVDRYRAETPDQPARVTLEWRHPSFEAALVTVAAGGLATLEEIPNAMVRLERRPTFDDVARYYPERALREDLEGTAELLCLIDISGQLRPCLVISETPADYKFGLASTRIARSIRTTPKAADGRVAAGRTTRVKLSFRLPD